MTEAIRPSLIQELERTMLEHPPAPSMPRVSSITVFCTWKVLKDGPYFFVEENLLSNVVTWGPLPSESMVDKLIAERRTIIEDLTARVLEVMRGGRPNTEEELPF